MIELILRSSVPSLGKAGDLVRVKPGYARNYLLPRGLAFEATPGNRKRIDAETRAQSARQAAERAEAEQLATRIQAVPLVFTAKAGEDGKLFGSVTAADIAERLAHAGHEIDKRKIALEHPLKSLGAHQVLVKLAPEVQAELLVQVNPED